MLLNLQDEDLALARVLQEQENAFMMLAGSSGGYRQVQACTVPKAAITACVLSCGTSL